MTILDTSFDGDKKSNGNNSYSADKKQAQPFDNPFARHIRQQAQNSGQIPNQKPQTHNLNRPHPHQINSSTEIANPFAEHIKLTKVSFAQVVQQNRSPARSVSTPSPSTLDYTFSPSSKLEHSNSAPVHETKASSLVDSDDIPGSDSSSTDNNGADTNSSIPKIPLYFGKHKSTLMVPKSADLKVSTGNEKPPSSSDAVLELQRIVKRAMVAGRLRRQCENCGATHHCCGRTVLEVVSDS